MKNRMPSIVDSIADAVDRVETRAEASVESELFSISVSALVVGGVTLCAALAWNDAARAAIDALFPRRGNSALASFVYAATVTAIVVAVLVAMRITYARTNSLRKRAASLIAR